ncbi:MAG: preprotein translocase subunit SecE [Thermoleophilia bacterium]
MAKTTTTKTTVKAPVKAPVKPVLSAKGARPAAAPTGQRLVRFFREVRIEMSKVTWPQRKELTQATLVVMVAVAIAASYIGLLDLVWSSLVKLARLG